MPQNYRRPPSPPPSYEEVAKVSLVGEGHHQHLHPNDRPNPKSSCYPQQQSSKVGDEEKRTAVHDELPPEYSTAVAMTPAAVNTQQMFTNISPIL